MKLIVQNKLMSLRGSSKVVDEDVNPKYEVKGKLFSITKKKFLRDLNGNLIYKIRNKYFKFIFHSAFIYDKNGDKVCKVKQSFWGRKYYILGMPDEIAIEGAVFSRNYQVLRNGSVIGNISRDFSLLTDHFTLEAEPEDIEFMLALVVALDNIMDRRSRED